jgi:hypothetical protein
MEAHQTERESVKSSGDALGRHPSREAVEEHLGHLREFAEMRNAIFDQIRNEIAIEQDAGTAA